MRPQRQGKRQHNGETFRDGGDSQAEGVERDVHGVAYVAGGFRFPVEQYLMSRGESYAAYYRPEAFVCLSESIDLHRIEPERIHAGITVIGVEEDQLVPLSDIRDLRDRVAGTCRLIEISSIYGHDAFLKETAVLRDVFAQSLE